VKRKENYVTDFMEQRKEITKGDIIDNDVCLLGNNADKRETIPTERPPLVG
jgi:hypothetical protein